MNYHSFPAVRCFTCGIVGTFSVVRVWPRVLREKNPRPGGSNWRASQEEFSALAACKNCNAPAFLEFRIDQARFHGDAMEFLQRERQYTIGSSGNQTMVMGRPGRGVRKDVSEWGISLDFCAELTGCYPSELPRIPGALPPRIRDFWIRELANVGSAPGARITCCRLLLEEVCKDRNKDGSGRLMDRINQLRDKGILTQQMADWAHGIRKLVLSPR